MSRAGVDVISFVLADGRGCIVYDNVTEGWPTYEYYSILQPMYDVSISFLLFEDICYLEWRDIVAWEICSDHLSLDRHARSTKSRRLPALWTTNDT